MVWRSVALMALIVSLATACGGVDPVVAGDSGPIAPADPGGAPPGAACSRPEIVRPADGWLGEAAQTGPGPGWGNTVDVESAELDALIERFQSEVGAGYTLTSRRAITDADCPGRAPRLSAVFTNGEGALVAFGTEQLDAQLNWAETPRSGEVLRSEQADGTEMVSNDFDGRGTHRRVWVARTDGMLVRVRAEGANAPDQSGWPTTMPTVSSAGDDAPPPGPAPLSLGELQALALALVG